MRFLGGDEGGRKRPCTKWIMIHRDSEVDIKMMSMIFI